MTATRTIFDDLIEGRLEARPKALLGTDGHVNVYRINPSGLRDQIATFYSVDAFAALAGGYADPATFNAAMHGRREQIEARARASATAGIDPATGDFKETKDA